MTEHCSRIVRYNVQPSSDDLPTPGGYRLNPFVFSLCMNTAVLATLLCVIALLSRALRLSLKGRFNDLSMKQIASTSPSDNCCGRDANVTLVFPLYYRVIKAAAVICFLHVLGALVKPNDAILGPYAFL